MKPYVLILGLENREGLGVMSLESFFFDPTASVRKHLVSGRVGYTPTYPRPRLLRQRRAALRHAVVRITPPPPPSPLP